VKPAGAERLSDVGGRYLLALEPFGAVDHDGERHDGQVIHAAQFGGQVRGGVGDDRDGHAGTVTDRMLKRVIRRSPT
jgi:hypothetical protein